MLYLKCNRTSRPQVLLDSVYQFRIRLGKLYLLSGCQSSSEVFVLRTVRSKDQRVALFLSLGTLKLSLSFLSSCANCKVTFLSYAYLFCANRD